MLLTRKIIRQRAEPLQKLTDDIHGAAEAGLRVPCLSRHRHLWTSDERAEQDVAASMCLACPALASCRTYADKFPEPAGVWGGRLPVIKQRRSA